MSNLDDLLSRIKKNKELVKEDFKGDTVREFISDFTVSKGVDKVPTYVLYYLYDTQFKTDGLKIKTTAFFRELSKYLDSKRSNSQRYYLIDKEKLNISRKSELEAREYVEQRKKKVNTSKT